MNRPFSFSFRIVFLLLLTLGFGVSRKALGQDHVVTSSDLQKDVAGVSAARQKNIDQVNTFISTPEAQKAIKSAHLDYQEVKNGVSQLNDEDLARLAARSEKAQKDFAAGNINDRDLLIILVAIVALILIIVAVR